MFEKRIAKLTSRLFGLSLDEAFNAADLLQLASAGALGLLNCPLFLLQKVVLQISLLVQSVSGTGNIPFKSTDIAHYFAIFVPKPLFDQLELLLPYCKAPPSRPRHTINTPTTHGKAKQADESTFEPISVAKGSISNTTTASTSAYWNCNICTFKNNGNQHTIYCSICHSKRVVIPATNEKTSDVIVIDDGDSVEAIAVDASSSVVILLDSESDDENDEKDEKDNSNVSDNNVISPTDSQSEMFLNTKLFSVFSSHTVSSSSVSTPLAPSSSHIITDEISDSIDDLEEAVDDGDDAAVAPKYLFSDDLVLMGLESIDQALFGPSSQYSPEQQVLVQAMYAMDTYQLEMQNLMTCSGVKSSFIPRSFTVFGRRFGNTINAKGKSRFIGPNDTICNVEQYMLGQCYQGDSDSSPVFVDAIRGFGWQGWHCEGACVRSLFALLMWEAVFSDQPDVFQTQYQDSPLDMGYPSFCRSRYRYLL